MNKKIIKIIYICICTMIILTKESYGYLDPSAMTYLLQIIAAIGVTLTTSLGVLFYKIKRKFYKKKKMDAEKEETKK